MVKNHAHHTYEPKYLLDYKVLKILNDSTHLLITPNGKEREKISTMLNLAAQQNSSKMLRVLY